jgi:hypothetical protein
MAILGSRGILLSDQLGRLGVMALVIASSIAPAGCTTDPQAEAQDQALAAIQRLGGTFDRDLQLDGEPVVKVDLSGRAAGDANLESLKGLPRLNALILRGTAVTDAGMAVLKDTGKLRSLDLDDCRVTDAGIAHLSTLTSLRGLHLAGTGITDQGVANLSPLTKLWVLSLRDTGITDAGLVHLQGLTSLRILDLEKTRVTQAGISRLRQDLPKARIVAGSRSGTLVQ